MFLITLFIVSLGLMIWANYDELRNESLGSIAGIISFMVVMSLIISIPFTFIVGLMFDAQVEHRRVNETNPIYSLRNDSTINGSFFLGCGNISDTEYYYMFTRDARGGYERCKLPSYNCILFQDETNSPHLSWQTIYYRPKKWLYNGPTIEWTERTKYDIHVPENTIIQKYEVK